ncbi:ribulose-phosphate 3-epimerase [Pediococcus ethanolidurans]|uniref:ribulose-phosphate 3-epimerase n=1 Tax=Pediococcus ethanolidurans TaxID=319653 RepID=UPI0021AA68FB|nr:ribulose-phosphate 3-epimerase [Pediococcus ethanolidurans]MCT4398525.1 ribulose-phosphate 3-epimerase [Pediococcus ethanolidurans]
MERLICPSLMCADFSKIKTEVETLENANVDIFHMDVMDGDFVPNLALGREDYETVRKLTNKPMDVHLMVQNPANFVNLFVSLGADIIYIHPEADQQPAKTIDSIRLKGKHPGIAINPGTSIAMVEELIPLVDYVLVMTVHPGFSGQKYLNYVDTKIKELVKLQRLNSFKLMVDGAISPEKINALSEVGVNGFIVGTSSLFGKRESYKKIVQELKGA